MRLYGEQDHYKVHIWFAFCILLGSAMSLASCFVNRKHVCSTGKTWNFSLKFPSLPRHRRQSNAPGCLGGRGGRKQLKLRIDLRISYVMCLMSISLSRCKVKRLLEQMYLSHFIVKSPSVTNLRLTSWLVNVDIHGAILGAHLIKEAFWCKARFFTVIKLLQSKRFNSNCVLPITNYSVPCGMDIFRVLIWGALQIGVKLQGRKTFGDT